MEFNALTQKTDQISDEKLSHFREVAIIAESKITEKINKALDDPETAGRRWFWELLQNAKDCATYNPILPEGQYNNIKGKKVDIVLTYFKNEEDYFLSFEHNGNPFCYTDDPDRFDDVKNLILPLSGKDNEYQTGKFGTGFLSTHILSLKINVEGTFLDKEQKLSDFSFVIDRSKFSTDSTNKELRKQFINSIVDAQINSVKYKEHVNPIKSKFTYCLNENIKQDIGWVKKIVEEGLIDLELLLPLVLCFNQQINSVLVNDEVNTTKTYYKLSPLKEEVFTNSHHLIVSKNDDDINILLSEINDIQLASYFDTEKDSANKYFISIDEAYKNKTKKKLPFIFSSFPLIGSEDFSFPMIINSKKFKPKETRDSISLKNNDSGNQTIIETAVAVYKDVLAGVSDEKWKRAYNIVNTNVDLTANHKWISDDWHKNKINTALRESILKEKIVDVPIDKNQNKFIRKAIKDNDKHIHFPIDFKKEKLWRFAIDLFPKTVPQLDEISKWNRILWDSERDFRKVNLEFLIKKISEFKNDIKKLATEIFGESDNARSSIIDWLFDFATFINVDLKQASLFDFKQQQLSFPILPNRADKLEMLINLNFDKGYFDNELIEDKTLDLYLEFCGSDLRPNLLNEKFNSLNILPNGRVISEKDLTNKICAVVNQKIKEGSLSKSDKTSLSELRNLLYDIKIQKGIGSDDDKKKRKDKYAQLYSDLDLDKLFLSVIEQEKIASVTKLLESDRNGNIDIKKLADNPDLQRIIELGIRALDEEKRNDADFQFKKMIGVYIEALIRENIKNLVADFSIDIIEEQNGQDIVVKIGDKRVYFIEVKSRWKSDNSIIMSNNQIKNAVKNKEKYSLCTVEMSDYNLSDRYNVTSIDSIIDRIKFINDIGEQIEPLIMNAVSAESSEDKIKLTNDYRAIIPQTTIKNGMELNGFVNHLISYLELKG